jgi:hypothetical protein
MVSTLIACEEALKLSLADSPAFRALVGAADRDGALARIYKDIADPAGDHYAFTIAELIAKRPYAVIASTEHQQRPVALGVDLESGLLGITLVDNPPDLAKNGGFDTDSQWTKGDNWTITGGQAVHATDSDEEILQPDILTPGDEYLIVFDIVDRTAGSIRPNIQDDTPGTILGDTFSANGTHVQRLRDDTATKSGVAFHPSTDFDGKIDNVKIYSLDMVANPLPLVADGDFGAATAWTVGTGWAIAGGVATHTPGNDLPLSQRDILETGRMYRVRYTVSGRTAGSVSIVLGDDSNYDQPGAHVRTADGTYTEDLTALAGGDLIIVPSADFDGDIDNVYVGVTPRREAALERLAAIADDLVQNSHDAGRVDEYLVINDLQVDGPWFPGVDEEAGKGPFAYGEILVRYGAS